MTDNERAYWRLLVQLGTENEELRAEIEKLRAAKAHCLGCGNNYLIHGPEHHCGVQHNEKQCAGA